MLLIDQMETHSHNEQLVSDKLPKHPTDYF